MSTLGLLILVDIRVYFGVWLWCQSTICFCFLDLNYAFKTLKEARELHCTSFVSTSHLLIVLISCFPCAIGSFSAGAIEDTNMIFNGEAIFNAINAICVQYI